MKERSRRKIFSGIVTSNKMNKTAVVVVERQIAHPLYNKRIKKRTKFYAHDEKNVCAIGDKVQIRETRPLSKTKRWVVVKILEKVK